MEIKVYRNKKIAWLFALSLSLLFLISGWKLYGTTASIFSFAASAFVFNLLIILLLIFFNSWLLKKLFPQQYQAPFSTRRFLFVTGLGAIASVAVVLLIYAAVFSFIHFNTDYGNSTEIKLPSILIFVILFYGFTAWKIKNRQPENIFPQPINGEKEVRVHIKTGNRHVHISAADIAWLMKKNGASLIKLKSGEEYITYDTLTGFFSNYLNETWFFRTDRKYIINKKSIQGYTRLPNRNLSLDITPGSPRDVTVNKNNVKEFMSWLNR